MTFHISTALIKLPSLGELFSGYTNRFLIFETQPLNNFAYSNITIYTNAAFFIRINVNVKASLGPF